MPEPPDRDNWEKQRETFGQELVSMLEDPSCDVFFGDEAGFEGDPRPRAKWVKRGSRPTQGYYGGHVRQNVVGAVNPASGQLVSLIVPHCDTEVFQLFLDTLAQEAPPAPGKRVDRLPKVLSSPKSGNTVSVHYPDASWMAISSTAPWINPLLPFQVLTPQGILRAG